ncbi:MAG TPA: exo-alpha-sialidase [Longimicrobiales bacterium]|nr:exo-alpha-sialidase [Longimicrobiales bacterium]
MSPHHFLFLALSAVVLAPGEARGDPAGQPAAAETIRVMTFNIWVGGEAGKQPLSQTAAVIKAARADIVGLQETGGEGVDGVQPDNARKLAEMLGWSYLDQGGRTGIITRLRIVDATPRKWGARIELPSGRQVHVFNAHLSHAPYQPYQLLGIPYNDGPFIKTAEEAVRFARESRGAQVERLLAEVRPALRGGLPCFVLGDFNEPSHLDWTDAAAAAGKCPIRVEWPASKAMLDLGFADTFRRAHPDAVGRRGDTWTPATREDDPKDRHDRIDFVYAGGTGVTVKRAEIAGEKPERADIVVAPYPSDHRGVVAEVEISTAVARPRAYTIPLVDLSGEKHRQVVVGEEPGQYLGHPTTVLLEDGKTMLVVYPKGHGRGAIVLQQSGDGGRTWSERLPVPASWSTSKETPTIHRVVDARGVRRLVLFSGLHPIRMSVSEDDGKTWSELKAIGNFGGIVAMASLVELRTGPGRYMALFHDDGRFLREDSKPETPPVFRVYRTLSSDGGLTWGESAAIAAHPSAHLCEPGAVRSPDGNEIAILLRENSRRLNSFICISSDEGETWSAPRELPGALTGDRHVACHTPDGRLFITFRDTTHESPTRGDWVGWVGTWEDLVQGREGQYRVRLLQNHKRADCAYAGLELLPDGTLVATTYGHWKEGAEPFIVSVRLKLEELDGRVVNGR